MLRATFLLLLVGLAAVAAQPTSDRIVGGSVTTINRWPFGAALLQSRAGAAGPFRQVCGGSIINNRAILTAAHCFLQFPAVNSWRVRVGSTFANSGGAVHNTARLIHHPNFNRFSMDLDVTVLHVTSAFGFNNNVRAGNIAGANYNLGDNQVVWAIGWGATSWGGAWSEQLRQVQIWTVSQAVCRERYSASAITNNMLCAGWLNVGGRDTCTGDSGGPVLHNNVIVGVVSFGRECARPRYPGVSVRVSRVSNWIRSNA